MQTDTKITLWFLGMLCLVFFLFAGVLIHSDYTRQKSLVDNGYVYLKGWYPKNILTCKE